MRHRIDDILPSVPAPRAEPGVACEPAGRYHIETWGCQMNVLDSDKLAGALERNGYRRGLGVWDADVILLNTCSIREKAEEKVFSELGRLRSLKDRSPDLVLGVCGCVAQQEGETILRRAPFVDLVVGPRATASLPVLVDRIRTGDESARGSVDVAYRDDSIHFPYAEIRRLDSGSGKAYVTIIEGCNHRCTFCIVPTTRGREINREMEDVLAEVRSLALRGTREIEFLGQTVNAYRDPNGRTLADLLARTADVEGIERIRFTTSHPSQMTDRLVEAMAAARPKLCPYLHLPVQSGSSRILRAMHRGYDREGYLAAIERIRERIPEMCFGTDVIAGFPSETEADFDATLSLVERVGFDTLYFFTYSPRPGTPARELPDDVPPAVKLARLARLQDLQKAIQLRRNLTWVGKQVAVLVEGPNTRRPGEWTGRTPEYRVVNFAGDGDTGRIVAVEILGATAFSLRGRATGRA